MPKIKTLDMKFLDEVFQMESGYVLDFSDRTMAAFFSDELNVDIYDMRYAIDGTSKAKRLRCFLQTCGVSFPRIRTCLRFIKLQAVLWFQHL